MRIELEFLKKDGTEFGVDDVNFIREALNPNTYSNDEEAFISMAGPLSQTMLR